MRLTRVLPISIIAKASKISVWKKNLVISNSFQKLFDKAISIAEIILNPNNENFKISEKIIKPNKIENNESFEYKSDSPERLEEASKRLAAPKKSAVSERPATPRNEENNNDNDEADESDEAYKVNEAYKTDKGDEYHNKLINIDETKHYGNFCENIMEIFAKYCENIVKIFMNIAKTL
ncbi:hypothetical protein Glove_173g86 [Diversispora epigaea]|uniref:Uncharacterized protein n=1 Tax=Diversispora epigaea TaxID=1348612 RepID=A0A397IP41_9GLOM|nr:hypothetical protein Glove_173g86 [Diversispora epigaea]